MLSDYEQFIKELESLGKDSVFSIFSSGRWSSQKKQWASDWLDKISFRKRDAREAETLSIAKEANDLARSSNAIARSSNAIASEAKESARLASISASKQARWAMWAATIATIAIIIAAMTYIKTP